MQTIPVVDLRDFLAGTRAQRELFVENMGDALRDIGFFALTNHGVDSDIINRAYSLAEDFYTLQSDTKQRYEDLQLKGQRGYTSFGREHAKNHPAPDLKEFFHVGRDLAPNHRYYNEFPKNIWPAEVPEFKTVMSELYKQLDTCSISLLKAASEYIGEGTDFLPGLAQDGNTVLRIIHYPPIPEDKHPASIRAAAHEDINFITLLCEATAGGLELLQRDGSWLPIHALKGQIIVDSGDMLQRLTNGYLKSTTHRVVNPDTSRERRFSMPFFVHPRSDVSLASLPRCTEKTGGKKVWPDITAGEYLDQRLREIGLGAKKA